MTGGSRRRLLRKQHLNPVALGLAVLLHGLLFGIMFIKVDSHLKPVAMVKAMQVKADKPVDIIEASAIDNKVLEKRKEKKKAAEREKKRKIAAEKKRKIEKEKKRKAEVKRKREEKIKKAKAEKKRKKEEEKKIALKKKLEVEEKARKKEEKKKADKEKARKKAEAKKKKLAEERKRKEIAEKKRKVVAERKRKEKEMKAQMEKRAREARATQAMSKYVPRIQQKVEANWNFAESERRFCKPDVSVNLGPDGRVLNANIVKSSGNPYCDSSVVNAFLKASPIPIPLDPDLYSEFKTITFQFRP